MISLYHSIARWQALVTAASYRLACYEAKDSPSKSILSQHKRRFYPILKTLELNAEKATFWRINHFLQPIPQANGQPALERRAVAIEQI